MRLILKNTLHFFPVQLFILHFRKYQVLLVLWAVLFSAVGGGFMKNFGMEGLLFTPEYLGRVDMLASFITGVALGMFVMSWNVTTFILHTKRFKFLATTHRPFLKYCINNSLLPLLFFVFYFIKFIRFDAYTELMNTWEITQLLFSVLAGYIIMIASSFIYFFNSDKRIQRMVTPLIQETFDQKKLGAALIDTEDIYGLRVSYYISNSFKIRKARDVSHYSQDFLDDIFKQHHFAAVISIVLAFVFLAAIGFLQDNKFFQLPVTACIFILFAILTAVVGALTYFLQSWSLAFIILLAWVINVLYMNEIIDPRNKAYGLNYNNKTERPEYNQQSLQELCTAEKLNSDKNNMLAILENWKKKQTTNRPLMIFINVSGGGLRSAAFTMHTLQKLDSLTNGQLMQHSFLISGASGGMLAAAYYRDIYLNKIKGIAVNLYDDKYAQNISTDLLNPVSASLITRDLFAPAQKFSVGNYKYVKDRGYAFEQKLISNCEGLLGGQLKDYSSAEKNAQIPLMILNSVITRDGRKMMIGTQPLSFMMKPLLLQQDSTISPDAIDFAAMFSKQDPLNIRMATALRMNATFPYILPNVWLPTNPVIDVMDAGLRDNFGQETTLRFIENFKDWIKENSSGVLILQMRDRMTNNLQQPFESGNISDIVVKPATMLQHNWQKMQDYSQTNQFNYFNSSMDSIVKRITFVYVPEKEEKGAALNFHLTAREKREVMASYDNSYNQAMIKKLLEVMK
jgi:hypothetical protein